MLKKIKNKAFTVAEALITIVLMGVIFVVSLGAINMKTGLDDYKKLYWQAFNTLYQASKATYDAWQKRDITGCSCNDVNQIPCYMGSCWRNAKVQDCKDCERQERYYLGGTKNIDRDFPGFLFNDNINNALAGRGQDEEFCENLVKKINTFPSGRCKSFISVANPFIVKDDNSTGGINFLKSFSYALEKDDGSFEQVNEKGGISPSFIALNGQKFYISSVVTANTPKKLGSAWEKFEHASRESFRFVVVDLNGDSKPNTQFATKTRYPDLVLFAINSMGDVIPLGLPEFSKSYINAIVYYPNDLNEDGSRMYPNIKSEPMILWNAKKVAFGNEVCGGATAPLPYGAAVSDNEPFSQSSRFYAVATACKGNVSACADKNVAADGIYADKLFVHLVMQFLFKKEGSTDLYPFLTERECIKNSAENGCEAINSAGGIPACAIDIEH